MSSKHADNCFDLSDNGSTNHWSSKYKEEESINWQNGNISEISYWSEDVYKEPRHTCGQKKILDYIGGYIHGLDECNEMRKTNEIKQIHKKLKKFQSRYDKFRENILKENCKNSYEYKSQNSGYSKNRELNKSITYAKEPQKVWDVAKDKNEGLSNVNFFEIFSQFAEHYVNEKDRP